MRQSFISVSLMDIENRCLTASITLERCLAINSFPSKIFHSERQRRCRERDEASGAETGKQTKWQPGRTHA